MPEGERINFLLKQYRRLAIWMEIGLLFGLQYLYKEDTL